MKKQIIAATVIIAGLAAYTLYTSEELTSERDNFVKNCASNNGIYAEGVLTKKVWRAADETQPDGKGQYLLTFVRHDLVAPTKATLPGIKQELDAPRRKLERGKSYSVCIKQDHELIDYYKSF